MACAHLKNPRDVVPESIMPSYGFEKTNIRDFDGNPDQVTEMDALVAYLQVLGTMVDFTGYDQAAAAPAAPTETQLMAPLAANATAGFIGMFLFMAFFAAVIYVLLRPGAKAAGRTSRANSLQGGRVPWVMNTKPKRTPLLVLKQPATSGTASRS
jgi:hypothetical protein